MARRKLPPDPDNMNVARARFAEVALDAFIRETGTDAPDAMSDLLCDLMHLADRAPESFAVSLKRARRHYAAETDR